MAGGSAASPDERRALLVRAIVEHRRDEGGGGDDSQVSAGTGEDVDPLVVEGAGRTVTYHDQSFRVAVDDAERDRLDDLCSEYHVFKVAQPETRKAPDGVVYLSAVTDAKHAADFLEALFREVYGADDGYVLEVG